MRKVLLFERLKVGVREGRRGSSGDGSRAIQWEFQGWPGGGEPSKSQEQTNVDQQPTPPGQSSPHTLEHLGIEQGPCSQKHPKTSQDQHGRAIKARGGRKKVVVREAAAKPAPATSKPTTNPCYQVQGEGQSRGRRDACCKGGHPRLGLGKLFREA